LPGRHLQAIVGDTIRQAISLRSGDSLNRPSPAAMSIIEVSFPGDAVTFHNAVQLRASLKPLLEAINDFHVPAQLAALAVLLLMAQLWARQGERRLAGSCVLILTALLANAFVCAAFSGTLDRYQSRIAWIAVAGVVMLGASRLEDRLPES